MALHYRKPPKYANFQIGDFISDFQFLYHKRKAKYNFSPLGTVVKHYNIEIYKFNGTQNYREISKCFNEYEFSHKITEK